MSNNHLRFHELVKLSLRTFHIKPVRAILTILGMSVGIGTVLFLVSLGYGLQYILIGKLVKTQDSLITLEASYPTESNLVVKRDILDTLSKSADVGEVSPVAEFPGEMTTDTGAGLLVDTLIVEPAFFRLVGVKPDKGDILKPNEAGVVVSSQTLVPLGLKIDDSSLGKKIALKVFYQDPVTNIAEEASSSIMLPIKGIIVDDSIQPQIIIFGNSLSAQPPFYRKALVKAKNIDVMEKLRDRLISQGFLISAHVDLVNQARKITNFITTVLGVFGITALVVSAIGMFNTMIVGFLERIYEVGILKSIGATDTDIRNLFLMESTIMGLLGGAGGVIIGVATGKILNFSLNIVAVRLGGKPFELFLTPWWFIALIMLLSLLIGLMSGLWPAHRATRLSPKEAFTRR